MPFPIAPILATGGALTNTIIGTAAQQKANEQNFDFQRQMYDRQRQDALTDRAFENDYNSPANQMARLKAAGLNPNMVYGNGASQVQSVSTRQATAPQGNAKSTFTPVDTGGIIDSLMVDKNMRKQDAETNLLEQQANVAKEQVMLTYANWMKSLNGIDGIKLDNAKKVMDNYIQEHTMDVSIDMEKQKLKKLQADTTYTLDQNERAEALKGQSIKESVQRILNMRQAAATTQAQRALITQQISNLQTDQKIKELDAKLSQMGIPSSSPWYLKIVGSILEDLIK